MYIHTEDTPNPNALKFFPSHTISPNEPIHFDNKDAAVGKSVLAYNLLNIENIKYVFFGSDFITITKTDKFGWNLLKPEILMVMMDHFVSGFTALDDISLKSKSTTTEITSEIEKQIIELIDNKVRPSVAMDGGDITYHGFVDGVVMLELHGSCAGCPSSTVTLKNGIENMLKLYVPEVQSVEEVQK